MCGRGKREGVALSWLGWFGRDLMVVVVREGECGVGQVVEKGRTCGSEGGESVVKWKLTHLVAVW